jgi:hypothetical protein
MKKVYVIGSLGNPGVPELAIFLRVRGFDAFDSWYSAGPEADLKWHEHSVKKGQSYREALKDYAAQHVYNFDKSHLDTSDAVVLLYPAGKSGHFELGYAMGKGKPGFILMEREPERWDVMIAGATVCYTKDELELALRRGLNGGER